MLGSFRLRLTLWYAAAFGASLAAFAGVVFWYVSRATDRRVDDSLREVAHAFVDVWRSTQSASPDVSVSASEIVRDFRADEFELVIFDDAQREVASNSRTSRVPPRRAIQADDAVRAIVRPDLAALFREAGANGEAFATIAGPSGEERGYAVSVALPGRRQIVAVLQDLASRRELLTNLSEIFLVLLPIALLVSFAGGLFLADRMLRPVATMTNQADRIEAHSLHERIAIRNPSDELGRLGTVLNHLLARLDDAFAQQRRFLTEAAHELRTPVTVIRGEADLALGRPSRPEGEYRAALEAILDESRRVTRIVDDLFLLARGDAAAYPVNPRPFDLSEVVHDLVAQTGRFTKGRSVVALADQPLPMVGDEDLVRRAIRNLLDNAVRYGKPNGTVRVRAARDGAGFRVLVEDDGPGIPEDEQSRIFDRFFRGRGATGGLHTDAGSGAGLGLAIASWIARMHGGELALVRSDPSGTTFALRLEPEPPRPA